MDNGVARRDEVVDGGVASCSEVVDGGGADYVDTGSDDGASMFFLPYQCGILGRL